MSTSNTVCRISVQQSTQSVEQYKNKTEKTCNCLRVISCFCQAFLFVISPWRWLACCCKTRSNETIQKTNLATQKQLFPKSPVSNAMEVETLSLEGRDFREMMQRYALQESPEALMEIVESSSYASGLLRLAEMAQERQYGKHKITVIFDDLGETAYVQEHKGIPCIFIHNGLSPQEKLAHFLFELTNIINDALFEEIYSKVSSGEIADAESFAVANERIEYEGCKQVSSVCQSCIREEGWDPSVDLFAQEGTFEEYLACQRELGHTQLYVNRFEPLRQSLQS